ncbi:FecR domain-containing protein (plasmid) [Croceibacterium sp. TMG7-5b_MA50]|uniref:FecR family protein n=1 Tax=Croceibacterium sp. TMG7-5b_MA50 TaxID=3121290 RepID=UPI003221FED5
MNPFDPDRGAPPSPARQASTWLARLHADDRTQQDEAQFRAWLAADDRHARAFEHASATWDLVGGLAPGTLAALAPRHPVQHHRRAVLVGGLATLIAGSAFIGWDRVQAGVYRTAVGEQRRLRLADGTSVMLDTQTRIRFRATEQERRLELAAGRIGLEVAADPRPFLLDLGGALADASVTLRQPVRLDLRRDDDRLALTVLDGLVRLGSDGGATALRSGQRVAASADGGRRYDQPQIADLTAWQEGRLAFRDETLAQAAAEMNRYTDRPLMIADGPVGALRVSGVYRVGDPEGFARSLSLLLPVAVVARADRVLISSLS